ncbi:MAG: TatD family hydrolase [Kangiellaceae bacterium]|nr:TatD family hydrolase [Kangiellaceae bacterium]
MQWVDIGINLTNKRFDKDRQKVILQALECGVEKLIITGTSVAESQKALELTKSSIATSNPNVLYSTAGCHPHDAKSLDQDGLYKLQQLLKHETVVAVGECGLDFNRDFSPRPKQIEAFKQQLELAVECQKPVFLHERDAFDTQFQILKDYMPQLKGAVSHCFTGEKKHMEAYLELGLSIGITGWLCDERRGKPLFDIVKYIPDDRLMIETDGPYLTPRDLPLKPKDGRNEPKFLPHIATAVARARGQEVEQVSNNTYQNSCRFFDLNS